MKALVYLLIVATTCWILSEVLEIAFGARTGLTLGLTAAFHLLMAGGIWGAYAGQRGGRGALSRAAAGMASLGFLVLVYPETVTMGFSPTAAAKPDEDWRRRAEELAPRYRSIVFR